MNIKKKNRYKVVRTILEAVTLIVIVIVIIFALFSFNTYEPFSEDILSEGASTGFVAISYFGVDRVGSDTLISTTKLEEELSTLYNQGFVTVTQEDVLNYMHNGKPLPPKSLFLMFEDGRRDTAIFAQKILEKYNFKASMLSYAEKMGIYDPKFLDSDQLLELEESSYWELGTNGYRIAYINAYDRYDRYLGEMTVLEFAEMSECLGRDYNHYLMDYIRDKYHVPKESYQQMYNRISADYEGMERVYTEKINKLPGLYILMHSNTGRFGNNEKVSAVNEEWIKRLFDMNFNRQGSCWNTTDNSQIYDLTRVQPQPYWYVNNLLMRIKYDSGLEVEFVNTDEEEYSNWNVVQGALECKPEKLIITSEPEDKGQALLQDYSIIDGIVNVTLTGNKFGSQILRLRGDANGKNGIAVNLQNNYLIVTDEADGNKELLSLNLDDFDGVEKVSVEEDMKACEITELTAKLRYAKDVDKAAKYTEMLTEASKTESRSVDDGAATYVPMIDIRDPGYRELKITLDGSRMFVEVDGKPAAELEISGGSGDKLSICSAWGGMGWSQSNIYDSVYDGVFEKLSVTSLPDADGHTQVIYDDLLHGMERAVNLISKAFNDVVDWFITNL